MTVVGAKTYALLSNLVAPTKPADKSYPELKEGATSPFEAETPDNRGAVQVSPPEPGGRISVHGLAAEISGLM